MSYKTELIDFQIGTHQLQIERVTNIDELYDALIAKGADHEDFKDERIPYWAELWHSAVGLSEYMISSGIDFKEKKVLEIGAGLALPSILAGKLGAEVTVSDYLQDAIDFAEKNWYRNNAFSAKFTSLDWRQPDESLAADILLAADVAYEKRMFVFLPNAFKHLCKKGGCILLSEPNRGLAKDFLQNLHQQGFTIEKTIISVELFDVERQINILKITHL